MVKQKLKLVVSNSSSLASQLISLQQDQTHILQNLEQERSNASWLEDFLDVSARYKDVSLKESLWFKQIAKAFWLQKGEDDLQFLYQSIRERKNSNFIKEIKIEKDLLTNEIEHAFCDYFNRLFNSNHPVVPLERFSAIKEIPT